METRAPVNVLFVSKRDSARSVLAEACLVAVGKNRFRAFSCGHPRHTAPAPHPAAEEALKLAGIDHNGRAGADWTSFMRASAPRMAFVITLAGEVFAETPPFPGQPVTALWAYPDLLEAQKIDIQLRHAMTQTLLSLRRRLEIFASLPMRDARSVSLRDDIRDLGHAP